MADSQRRGKQVTDIIYAWVACKAEPFFDVARVRLDEKGRPYGWSKVPADTRTNQVIRDANKVDVLYFPEDFDGVQPKPVTQVTQEHIDEQGGVLKDNIDKLLGTINSYIYQYEQQND